MSETQAPDGIGDGPDVRPLPIDVVSDVMCPWCYIGKRRLEGALALLDKPWLDIRWRPYQLDPTLPAEGKDRTLYLNEKFGGAEKAATIYGQIEAAGADVGLDFRFADIKVSPNTLDAHRLIRWSSTTDEHDAVVEALFHAYFMEGRNIGETTELVRIAEDAGMDGALVGRLLAGDADRDLVQTEIATAQEMGIQGVPCFILGNRFAVSGAQSPEVLANAIIQAANTPPDAVA
ncbi:MAG: DsbA family oxidoreductase [Pseudomonadota bacterium]